MSTIIKLALIGLLIWGASMALAYGMAGEEARQDVTYGPGIKTWEDGSSAKVDDHGHYLPGNPHN